jgi:hypothetical protein
MILHAMPDGLVAIPQSAHAFLAFQLADHWGNRLTPRPSPRAEVLAVVLLHDLGWDGREESPRLGPDGLPIAFDTLPDEEREPVWTASVERAALRGRYVAYLVSHHVTTLATRNSRRPHLRFVAREETRRARLCAEMANDARYAATLRGRIDEINRAVVRLVDEIAVHLSQGTHGKVEIPDLPQRNGSTSLTLEEIDTRVYRLHPWPLLGRRLDLHTEGLLLPAARFADEAALREAWLRASSVHLRWSLLAAGTPRD